MPQCPLYEEVLDTQMFGLSREIDFAVRLGLVDEKDGKAILDRLERELSALHEACTKRRKMTKRSVHKKKKNDKTQTNFVWVFLFYSTMQIRT